MAQWTGSLFCLSTDCLPDRIRYKWKAMIYWQYERERDSIEMEFICLDRGDECESVREPFDVDDRDEPVDVTVLRSLVRALCCDVWRNHCHSRSPSSVQRNRKKGIKCISGHRDQPSWRNHCQRGNLSSRRARRSTSIARSIQCQTFLKKSEPESESKVRF